MTAIRGPVCSLLLMLVPGCPLLMLVSVSPGWAQGRSAAAVSFDQGQALFAQGQYQAALERFRVAQRLAPHRATLFNIARCHENLGQHRAALAAYRAALASTSDPTRRADLQQRIARLAAKPGRLFLTTHPAGVRVSVDGASRGETSPVLLSLAPGPHMLVLEHPAHQPLVHRVVIEPAGEQTVQLSLVPRGAAPPPPCRPQVLRVPAPARPLIRFDKLQVHGGPALEVFYALGWSTMVGLSLHAGADLGRLSLGGRLLYLPVRRDGLDTDGRSFLFIGEAEVGWTLAWRFAQLTLGGVLGIYLDRISEFGQPKNGALSGEEVGGVLWGGMVNLGAAATRWLSIVVAVRGGMLHGKRIVDPTSVAGDHHFPFLSLTAALLLRFGG